MCSIDLLASRDLCLSVNIALAHVRKITVRSVLEDVVVKIVQYVYTMFQKDVSELKTGIFC